MASFEVFSNLAFKKSLIVPNNSIPENNSLFPNIPIF